MQYPKFHKRIVQELTGGKFITEENELFAVLNEHRDFYSSFFEETYHYILEVRSGFFFLSNKHTEERASTDLLLWLSLLAYEYQNMGKDLVQKMCSEVFFVQELVEMAEGSSKYELVEKTQARDLPRFLDFWARRNVLGFVDKEKRSFRFGKPIQVFLEVAAELHNAHLEEQGK